MAKDQPWLNPRVAAEPPPQSGLFTTNYNALIRLNSQNGTSVFISHSASADMAGIGTMIGNASVINGSPSPATSTIDPTVHDPEVPIDAERVLAWITKPDRLEFVLDTFEENFQKRVLRDGGFAARQWYRWQVIRTLCESILQLSPPVAGFIYLLRKIGIL